MKRRFLLIFTLFIIVLSGCAREPRAPGVLKIVGVEPSTLDPARSYDTTSISLVRVLYRGLVDYGDGADIVPVIAKEYSISPDGKTYSFTLRDDVRFHYDLDGKSPGRRVVAEDFRYAIERVLTPATASDGFSEFQKRIVGAQEFSQAKKKNPQADIHVRGITVTGDNKISIQLVQPDATFINWLTLPFSYALDRAWVEKWESQGETLSEHPNGTGPFMLDEWMHDDYVHLQKNAYYFDPKLPGSERIEQQISNAKTLDLMRFELGDIDVYSLEELSAPDYLRLMRNPKWRPYIKHAPMMDVRYLCMNTEIEPFDNKLVRRAVNHAINKERIVSTQAGRVEAARGILPPGMPAYNPNLNGHEYNPDKARALLKQAGFKNDPAKPITLWFADMLWYPNGAQMIQQDLKKVGMTVNLKSTRYPELKAASGQRKRLALSIMGWIQDYPDPANFLDVLFNGKSITQTASLNRAFYDNPRVNELLDAAGVETNRAKRLAMYSRIEQMIMDDAPWVPLVHTERYVAHQPWIKGYNLHPMWSSRYEFVKVDR